jgi:glycerate-2-kinase
VRRGFSTSQADPISLPTVQVSGSGGLITVGGEVHDKSGRSMQLLASFVDGLRGIRMFEHVSEPEYRETSGNDGSSSSPFTLTITLARE